MISNRFDCRPNVNWINSTISNVHIVHEVYGFIVHSLIKCFVGICVIRCDWMERKLCRILMLSTFSHSLILLLVAIFYLIENAGTTCILHENLSCNVFFFETQRVKNGNEKQQCVKWTKKMYILISGNESAVNWVHYFMKPVSFYFSSLILFATFVIRLLISPSSYRMRA